MMESLDFESLGWALDGPPPCGELGEAYGGSMFARASEIRDFVEFGHRRDPPARQGDRVPTRLRPSAQP